MPKANVSAVRCGGYSYEDVRRGIEECLRLLPGWTAPAGSKVLLKPNMLSASKGPEQAVNTHPSVIEALADIFKNRFGNTVYIGDSCGGLGYGKTEKGFAVSGYIDISRRLGVELVNFDNTGVIEIKNGYNRVKKSFLVTRFFQEAGFIVSVPKLKTHTLVGFTGAVKNMMGLVPGSGKRDMHMYAPKARDMAQCIVDLYSMVKPSLSVMDAVVGMEGEGPAGGMPRHIGALLAGTDAVAVDSASLAIIGYKWSDNDIIRYADERGVGMGDMKKIEIYGEPLDSLKINDFIKPGNRVRDYLSGVLPAFVLRKGIEGMTTGRPVVNQSACRKCYECYRNCPVETIKKLPDGRIEIDHSECIECYCCQELCPYNAVDIRLPLPVKLMRKAGNIAGRILRKGL